MCEIKDSICLELWISDDDALGLCGNGGTTFLAPIWYISQHKSVARRSSAHN